MYNGIACIFMDFLCPITQSGTNSSHISLAFNGRSDFDKRNFYLKFCKARSCMWSNYKLLMESFLTQLEYLFEWNLTKWFYGLISILFMTVTHRNRSGLRWESLSFSRWGQMQSVLWYVTIFFSWGPSEPSSILIYLIEHIIWINFFHGKLSRLKT